ncbi:MAG TPA: intradiol ring-cleavage dioxygenase [Candidatus Limnocylindrales bacterium]|nr:intradiol ring-cleavage dioxygenase [Candidatus Limnocylindrales bacterium]
MRNLTEDNVTEAVLQQIKTDNPRLQQIMNSLIRNLHNFIREVELTEEEWSYTIQFLTRVGHRCDDRRQEFILLSDTLGVSILVDAINHRKPAGATESTILGPFYRAKAPNLELGANIALKEEGEPVVVRGQVTDLDGKPIANALLDVWHASAQGLYDIQDPSQEISMRGRFLTNTRGEYWFRTIKPSSYPIPHDGPVGEMLAEFRRHPYRPAHIHFIVSAEGYETVVTHIFVEGDPYLDSDAVFAVKNSLVADFVLNDSVEEAKRWGVVAPFYTVEYNFKLVPVKKARP